MFDVTSFETRRRVRGTVYLGVVLLAYAALVVGIYPSISQAAVDIQSYIESLPPEVRRAFVGEASTYTTIEGFLSAEMYQFVILILLGMYFAYAAASGIAGEIDDESLELLLAGPISRTRVAVGKYLALVPSMVVLNGILYFGTAIGVDLIGEHLDLVDLAVLHLLSIPYLLACAGLGLLASVRLDSVRRAQTVGAGAVFGMFIVDAVTVDTDYEWIGDLAFSRYYNTAEILVETEIVWGDIAVLFVAAIGLVVVSAELFERRDL